MGKLCHLVFTIDEKYDFMLENTVKTVKFSTNKTFTKAILVIES